MVENLKEKFSFPWYKQGLSFKCTQCGKCCTGSPGFIWIIESEITAMAHLLKVTPSIFKRLYVRRIDKKYALVERKSQNHSCVFYQNAQCQVYAARPLQCRAYPFWQENLFSEQSWQQAAQDCEGIHPDAPAIACETIENLLEEQERQEPQKHFVPRI